MQITVLIENSTQNPALVAEHGLSLFIRHGGRSWLLDAGTSGDFVRNADALGLPPEQVQAAILSHGHYDHGGGLAAFFARNRTAPVYAMRAAGECYLSGDGPDRHPIGLPDTVLPRYARRFVWLDGPAQPAPGVTLLPHTTPGMAAIGAAKKLYRAGAGRIEPDDFRHEITAVFETDAGLVAVNSCSHGGVPAILAEVQARFPGRPVRAFVGGLHLRGRRDGREICTFSPQELRSLADSFRRCGVQAVYTGHCTGTVGYTALQSLLGELLHPLSTGMQISL